MYKAAYGITTGDSTHCQHAHWSKHTPSVQPYDLYGRLRSDRVVQHHWSGPLNATFLRHNHGRRPIGSCAFAIPNRQGWELGFTSLGFAFFEYEPSGRWPDKPGNYLMVRHTDEQRYPIYAGYTEDLRESLREPDEHERAACFKEQGVTHIHARLLKVDRAEFGMKVADGFIQDYEPPCNDFE